VSPGANFKTGFRVYGKRRKLLLRPNVCADSTDSGFYVSEDLAYFTSETTKKLGRFNDQQKYF
jgi:hypothetical protein